MEQHVQLGVYGILLASSHPFSYSRGVGQCRTTGFFKTESVQTHRDFFLEIYDYELDQENLKVQVDVTDDVKGVGGRKKMTLVFRKRELATLKSINRLSQTLSLSASSTVPNHTTRH